MNNKYQHIFFDLDRTLWDFDSSARMAFSEIYENDKLEQYGIESVDAFQEAYNVHNDLLWADYREGKIKKEVLRGLRFRLTLNDFGVDNDELAEKIGRDYITISPLRVALFPNAMMMLDYLQPKYNLHLITNGFSEVQETKLRSSGLGPYFQTIITSEEAGYKKPDERIFRYAFNKSGAKPELSLMIGDDLEVDIVGAQQFDMDQVLFDPAKVYENNKSTYYINDLIELKEFL